MKKYMKFMITAILMLLVIGITNTSYTYAAGSSLDKVISEGDQFLEDGDTSHTISDDDILETSDYIYSVLIFIGIAVVFIWGVVLGIRFVTGAMTEKADVKQELMIYLFGCIIIFLAPTIWKVVLNIANSFNN